MKRIIILCLSLALLLACVPTPEVDAVKQKDTNVLIDTVRREEQKQEQQGEAESTFPPVKEQFPERFACDFYTSAQNVHVVSDVPLEVLTDGTFPTLRVERRILTDRERMTVAQRVFGTDKLYIFEEHVTRKDLERWIRELMQEPSPEEKAEWMREENSTEEEWQEMMERRKENIAELQKRYNELPDDDSRAPLMPWDGTVPDGTERGNQKYEIVSDPMPEGYLSKQNYLTVYAEEHDRPLEYCVACESEYDVTFAGFFDGSHKFGAERIDPKDYDKPHEGASVTPNDAIKLVLDLFDGVFDAAPADVYWANNAATDGDGAGKSTRWAYFIHFSHDYGGSYTPYCSSLSFEQNKEAGYARIWRYETLMAAVDGEGNLISFDWFAPLKVTETIAESTTLLKYEEIQKIFEAQMNRLYADESYRDGTVTLQTAQLGLFRIREQNDMEHGLMVPVWFFTGVFEFSDETATRRRSDGLNETQAKWEYRDSLNPLLIINAIDGSIIDPMKGY